MNTKVYPRTNDFQTIYLNTVIKNPAIIVGDYTIYNDFINDPLVDIQHDIKESKSIVQNSIPDSDFMKTLKENNKIVYHKNDPDEADVRRILIVEDNVELLNLLAEIFSPLYQVYKATNGDDGLRITIKEQPDIVLSDVMMPGISGNV